MTEPAVLPRDGLDRLVEVLRGLGYRVVGPTVRDNAIVLAELDSPARLPSGWGVETGPGTYRLRRRADAAVFGHSAGPQSWKQFLHPPREKLWSADRADYGFAVTEDTTEQPRYAFLGVRGCDLAAIAILDQVLDRGQHSDSRYHRRREGIFIVAANCTEPGELCFCASMGCGPGVTKGYDLALTERLEDEHDFLVDVGSERGAEVLATLDTRPAGAAELAGARDAVTTAAGRMGRTMPTADLPAVLAASRESARWSEIADRCLTCGNCTMVCPTCFCTTTEDVTDLTDDHAERWQHWASCFDLDYSYIHGGEIRSSGASRYRQWMSHKLGTWQTQFGTSGCVGCGRCIAWCPVGIDLTEEVDAFVLAAEGRSDVDADSRDTSRS
jgi:ferredoxin